MKINVNEPSSFLSLKDGRHLGFANYGALDGFPVLFFHGLPGTRLEAEKLHLAAVALQIRLIGLDRPGMGLSSPQKNRTILDWAEDMKAFASALNLNKFSMIGHSGGAPYVAACAYAMPENIHKAVIVSGVAPLTYKEAVSSLSIAQKTMNLLIKYCPVLFKLMLKMSCNALENPKRLQSMLKRLPEIDAKILENKQHLASMVLSLKEAFRQNASWVVDDFKLLLKSWGFDLKDIRCPWVVWQGGEDTQAPPRHAEIYKQYVPGARHVFIAKEGHLSILYHYGEQILASALEKELGETCLYQ